MIRLAAAAVIAFVIACGPGAKGGPSMNNRMTGPEPVAQGSEVVSGDILAREPVANNAKVKHILIGWKDLDQAHDDRAKKRTKPEAEALVRSLMTQIKAGADFDLLMKQHSEDPGSAATGRSYDVSPDAQLVIEFKQLGLRLNVNEVGVVQSDFGFHIIKRVE
ncbi:MAG TPA: peptidylprolyl isomerase [Kofleriaceae bacterium]|nr:peptidylprolyl isomerase [Kofleriaceae bacterium]